MTASCSDSTSHTSHAFFSDDAAGARHYLGYDVAALRQQGGYWTAREISQQPALWRQLSGQHPSAAVSRFLAPLLQKPDLRIILTGAGTSAYIGQVLAAELQRQLAPSQRVEAIATTDLVSNPSLYLHSQQPVLLVSYGRSGNSPESVAAVELAEQLVADCSHLIITCNGHGKLAAFSQQHAQRCFLYQLPEQAHDQSFAMTSSFTGMYLATLLSFAADPASLEQAAAATEQLLQQQLPQVQQQATVPCQRMVFLGSGPLQALCREAALKYLELTAGRVLSHYESPLGFRHGPKSLVDGQTQVLLLQSNDRYTQLYDRDLFNELQRDGTALQLDLLQGAQWPTAATLSDVYLALPYIVWCQTLAFFKALQLGISPDNPCPSGQVNRVVQGVTLHPLPSHVPLSSQALCYGLDIGGSKIELAIFDANLQVQQKWRVATPRLDYAEFLAAVLAQITKADAITGQAAPVGIALPGALRHDGTVLSSNLPCLNNHAVARDLSARLRRPVAIGNDCRCFALSEAVFGAGRGRHKVLGYILGTGAGGGFCVNGQLLPGRLAGEYGHVALSALVRERHQLPLFACGCGQTGCVEPYISGTGLARLFQHFGGSGSSEDWLSAYRSQDQAASRAFAAYIDALGAHLAGLCLSVEPECIVLGGGLSQVPEIFRALPHAVQSHLFAGVEVPPIVVAEGGDASGERGAALLGLRLLQEFPLSLV